MGGGWGIPRIEREIGGSRSGESLLAAVEATGGDAVPGDEFDKALPELMDRIRMRYLLGFYAEPTLQRQYHALEVRLTPEALKLYPGALVKARRGYYTDPSPTSGSKSQNEVSSSN